MICNLLLCDLNSRFLFLWYVGANSVVFCLYISSTAKTNDNDKQKQKIPTSIGIPRPSEHGLTCLAWNDCLFEPAKLAVGGYSKKAVVWTFDGKWREVMCIL